MKIVFFGTPKFAQIVLEELCLQHEVVLVVTQEDKLVGRHQVLHESEVKEYAIKKGLKVFQPKKIKEEYTYILENFDYDLILTAAYGQILPMKLINSCKYRAINVHASLLPKYRGASPIQTALMNGDDETGVSIMYMEKGMDTGDVIKAESIKILDDDTADTLFDKLAYLGAKLAMQAIKDLEKGSLKSIKQDDSLATYTKILTKEDEHLDFNKSARLVNCQIRAISGGCFASVEAKVYKFYSSTVEQGTISDLENGCIAEVTKNAFKVKCGDGALICFDKIKPEGKALMGFRDFYNGKGKDIFKVGVKLE